MILSGLPAARFRHNGLMVVVFPFFYFNQKEHVTPASHGEGTQSSSHSFSWVGLDQGRPKSGPDLLLYKSCETVMFE